MRTIAVFTGNRAEYGLLYPILKAIHQHPNLQLNLYVGGDHLRDGTIVEIKADGLPIQQELEPITKHQDSDHLNASATQMNLTTSIVVRQLHDAFMNHRPDFFFVLGDRYESFAAALAAFYHGIPIVHLGGGDITEGGCVDDTLRFMISQMAHLHFVISKESGQRLIQRGEESWRIHITSSPVIDNIINTRLIPKSELCQFFNFDADKPVILFTQHPIPIEGPKTIQYFQESLQVLAELNVQVIATAPNKDGFGTQFEEIMQYSEQHHPNIRWVQSLGRQKYLSWMAACDVVVGNSSSGLIETPFFRKPSISIGSRQTGRQHAENVLTIPYGKKHLKEAIEKAFNDSHYLQQVTFCQNPFGDSPCAPKICETLSSIPIDERLLKKHWQQNSQTEIMDRCVI